MLDELGEKQRKEMKELKARHKQMDKATEEIIRNLEEENRVAKEKQLKKLEFLQGSNPILANLEDDIESIQSNLCIHKQQLLATEQTLESMQREEHEANTKYSSNVEDLKLRQAMGGGAVHSGVELPGVRITIAQTVEWLGGTDRFKDMNRNQLESVFRFLSKTGLQLNHEFYDQESTIDLLSGGTRKYGLNES